MKIGIATFHNVINYGGILQAYALTKYLNQIGHTAECIDYRNETLDIKYDHKLYDVRKSILDNLKHFVKYYLLSKGKSKEAAFDRFISQHIPLSEKVDSQRLNDSIDAEYDVIVIGSDQVWNPKLLGGKLDEFYLANFARQGQPKVSYASSAGSYRFDPSELNQIKAALSTFKAVSVRESFLKDQLTPLIDPVSVVVDPTLLLTKDEWLSISTPPAKKVPDQFVLIYTFDSNKTCFDLASQIAQMKALEIVTICAPNRKDYLQNATLAGENIGPSEFVYLFSRASYVVTNSFHGTIFSMIFSKPFYSVYKKNNPERVRNLLANTGLTDRMVNEDFTIKTPEQLCIDYDNIDRNMKQITAKSKAFLSDSLS